MRHTAARHTTALHIGALYLVLAAIGCSGTSSTEKPGNSDSPPPVAVDSPDRSSGGALEPAEARVLRALALIAPHSPTGNFFPTNVNQAHGIELVAADEPLPRRSTPANIPLKSACTSQGAALSKESQRTLETAIQALEIKVNVAIDNLANAQTPGFKRRRVILAPLAPRHDAIAGVQDSAGNLSAVGIAVGQECKVDCIQTDFSQGAIVSTARPLDLAIEGDGFFQVQLETGELAYTRVANLNTNPNGGLVIGSALSGHLIQPPTHVPPDALELTISLEGNVAVRQPGVASLSQIGCLQLARFINNDGLRALAGGLYSATDASGPAALATAGQQGMGRVRQGALEASNVKTERELANLREWRSALSLLIEISRSDSMPASP